MLRSLCVGLSEGHVRDRSGRLAWAQLLYPRVTYRRRAGPIRRHPGSASPHLPRARTPQSNHPSSVYRTLPNTEDAPYLPILFTRLATPVFVRYLTPSRSLRLAYLHHHHPPPPHTQTRPLWPPLDEKIPDVSIYDISSVPLNHQKYM